MKMHERIRLWSNYSINAGHRTDMLACADLLEIQSSEIQRLREAINGAANYIDTLGGDSKKYRIVAETGREIE